MSVEIIQDRLLSYQCKTVLEQENALKEIAQEIALMSLSRAGFFKYGAFQGGTCLRILYHLNRFSEDLDFVLLEHNKNFSFEPFLKSMKDEFEGYGYALEIVDKEKLQNAVKTVFLKADSMGGLLILKDPRTNRPKIQIKLEIDSNPPAGSTYEMKFLNFPLPYSVYAQDSPSLFASKSHALLCRPYTKGRDWYDFVWYVMRKTSINYELLSHAIDQKGPWEHQHENVNKAWFVDKMEQKILQVDWEQAKQDVEKFLAPREVESLALWSKEFFLSVLADV